MHLIEEKQKPIELPIDTRTEEQKKADMEKHQQLAQAKAKQAELEEIEQEKQEVIKEMAQEWADREFYRRSLNGDLAVNKKQFIEMIWERAMFEAELEFRQLAGERFDVEMEREEWKMAQKAKVKAGLKANLEKMKKRMRQEIDSV